MIDAKRIDLDKIDLNPGLCDKLALLVISSIFVLLPLANRSICLRQNTPYRGFLPVINT